MCFEKFNDNGLGIKIMTIFFTFVWAHISPTLTINMCNAGHKFTSFLRSWHILFQPTPWVEFDTAEHRPYTYIGQGQSHITYFIRVNESLHFQSAPPVFPVSVV